MKDKKTNRLKIATIILSILVLAIVLISYINSKDNFNGMVISEENMKAFLDLGQEIKIMDTKGNIAKINEDCKKIYAGICFDEESKYYKSNLEKDQSIPLDWEIANVMNYMENEKLQIFGMQTCGWCIKQKEEFGDLIEHTILKGLYIECSDSKNKELCSDVKYTPTWKKNGKIISTGYVPLDSIEEYFSNESNF